MQLQFEHTQNLGPGTQPSAIHTPENIVQILYVGDGGRIYAKDAPTPMGEWADLEFSPAYLVCTDVDVQHMKLKYVSANSLFVVWRNDTDPGETVPPAPGETHTLRHRFAMWALRQNLSKYLISGSMSFREDDPVSRMAVEFENPGQIVSSETDSILTPGTSLTFFFRAGNSARYIMGRYFLDENRMGVPNPTTRADGRNAIGKILDDQSFDEDNVFASQTLAALGEALMQSFNVQNYWIGDSTLPRGFEFTPSMKGLEGFLEVLKTVPSWKLEEDLAGTIGFGPKDDPRFTQPSVYTFERDKDVFSLDVKRQDSEVYSRVCVHNRDYTIAEYRNVDFRFTLPRKKTLHALVAEGTTLADAQTYADELASLVSGTGVIETFVGPWRPHIWKGDEARILSSTGSRLIGQITSFEHAFGKDGKGYITEFTVDSGGRIGREQWKQYLSKVAGKVELAGSVKRLYA